MFYKILKYILVFFIFIFLFLFSISLTQFSFFRDIQSKKDFDIFLISTNEYHFLTAYILHYSIQKQLMFIFPINKTTRFINNNTIYLADVYQKIYYKNKRNDNLSRIDFMRYINSAYNLNIENFIAFDEKDIIKINSLFNANLDYKKIVSFSSTDKDILDKYLNIKSFFEQFNVFNIIKFYFKNFNIVQFNKNIDKSNMNLNKIFLLLYNIGKLSNFHFVFVGYNNVLYNDDNLYINSMVNNIDKKDDGIAIEVLNASGNKGLALDFTRFLRNNHFDVQSWGNYSALNNVTMVIDRRGLWRNAQAVYDFIKQGVLFSKEDKNSLSSVSVILGKDIKNFKDLYKF